MNEFFSLLTEACGEWDTGQVMFDVGERMEQYKSRAPGGPNEMAGLGEKMMKKKKIFFSKPERKTPIQYTNSYIWNLERW